MKTEAIIETIALIIKEAVILGPIVIKGVEDAKPFATAIYQVVSGHSVTQQELDDLVAQFQALSAQLQTPLEPEGPSNASS